jgi:hypothetical protein
MGDLWDSIENVNEENTKKKKKMEAKCEPRSKLVSKIPPGFLVQALALSS